MTNKIQSSDIFVQYKSNGEYYPISLIEDAFQPEVIGFLVTSSTRGIIEWKRITTNSNIYNLRINNNCSIKDIKISDLELLKMLKNGICVKQEQF